MFFRAKLLLRFIRRDLPYRCSAPVILPVTVCLPSSVRCKTQVPMPQDIALQVPHRTFSPDEQKGVAVVHLAHLIRCHELPSRLVPAF